MYILGLSHGIKNGPCSAKAISNADRDVSYRMANNLDKMPNPEYHGRDRRPPGGVARAMAGFFMIRSV